MNNFSKICLLAKMFKLHFKNFYLQTRVDINGYKPYNLQKDTYDRFMVSRVGLFLSLSYQNILLRWIH